jgi:murein L,D-transpeptidase YafK
VVNDRALPEKLGAPHIVIYKSRRRLELYDGEQLLRTYQVALGRQPLGDKLKEGDGATPEGTFYVCTKNAKSRYDRFVGVSYPNAEDGARGLRAGLISAAQNHQIRQAMERGVRPPWDTKLGGQIGIHGGGVARDWTQGCVAVTDEAIEELFEVIPYGTVVAIKP